MLETESETAAGGVQGPDELYCPCLAGPFASQRTLRLHQGTEAHTKRLSAVADGRFGVLRGIEKSLVPDEERGATFQGLDAYIQRGRELFAAPEMSSDLRAIVDAVKETPQQRAKMVRHAFAVRGWPNEEHPGTVLDFLKENQIPYV